MFSGTIESNLKYANKNASNEELIEAIEIAQAMEFVKEKPKGLASEISQGGANVSGGGAKAEIIHCPCSGKKTLISIYLMIVFSALDFKTDAALRKALNEKTKSSTIIMVAQRISTIIKAEQIIVLDEGSIVGKGTHEQLMKNCKTYQEIALSQLSEEELA